MNDIQEFENAIKDKLDSIESSYAVSKIIKMTKECKEEIITEELHRGGSPDITFWNYLSDGIASIFTVFSPTSLEIYVFREAVEKVTPFLDTISMSEVSKLKEILKNEFGINKPSCSVARPLAEIWLS